MLISTNQFENTYGSVFKHELESAKRYLDQPLLLQDEIEKEKKLKDPDKLYPPYPDPFSWRMTRYRGFVRFPERLKNFVVSENEAASVRRSYLPHIIDLEPNATCNFRCVMCHVSEWKNGKRAENVPLETFKEFVDCNPQLTEVKLHGMGEPLLHPDYFKMIQYLAERDIWVRTSTNGSILHAKDKYRLLIDSGIGEIQISFDGATREIFETIRRRGRFERVKNNCTLLNKYANSKEQLFTRMWVVVQKYNRDQLLQFVELAAEMKFRRLSFSFSLNDWGLDSWRTKNRSIQTEFELSPQEEQDLLECTRREGVEVTVWRQASKYSSESPNNLCPWVFSRPYISCDMNVVPCAMIANPEVSDLGDAMDFQKTWNNKTYRDFRQMHLEGRIPDICKACYVQKKI